MKRNFLYTFLFLVLLAQTVIGQNFRDLDTPPNYNKELTADVRAHNNGFAIAGNFGLIQSARKTHIFQLEITSIKHPRERRQSRENISGPFRSPKAFIYGKQNSFYAIHPGYGGKLYFSDKARRRGVAVGMNYVVGPSIGVLKPYYLALLRFNDNMSNYDVVHEAYSEENASDFLNTGAIYGASGFSYGLDELKFLPGAHAKAGIYFDWGMFNEFVKAMEVGIMVDAYTRRVPIMLTEDNNFIFINLYMTLQIGRRWH